jgi:Na+/H+ antiporter NhaC
MIIAFATGTSLGTYAVMFPISMPLAFELQPELLYIQICFGAIMGGAVFGDQCSHISDTTIFSSMLSGCDLMDHVKTQLPLALLSAFISALLLFCLTGIYYS